MKDIETVFGGLNLSLKRGQTISEIAIQARVARGTVYNAARYPERSSLAILRRIFDAMGYRMIVSLEEKQKEAQNPDP